MQKILLSLALLCLCTFIYAQQVNPIGGTVTAANSGDGTGVGVAISEDGNTLAIGDRFFNVPGGGSDGGRVRVFKLENGAWVPKGQNLQNTQNSIDLWAGTWLDLSPDGNTLIGGIPRLPNTSGVGNSSGGAVVYQYNSASNSWSQKGGLLFSNTANAYYGRKVAISNGGDVIHVAGYTANSNQGRVLSYFFNGSIWNAMGWGTSTTLLTGSTSGEWYGYGLDATTNTAITGNPEGGITGNNGYVEVRTFSSPTWNLKGTAVVGPQADCRFGSSVEISEDGNRFIAGGYLYDGAGTERGYAACYEWDSTASSWQMLGAPFIGENDGDRLGFGTCINNDGDLIAVAAHNSDSATGSVKVYHWSGSSWNQVGNTLFGDNVGDAFGYTTVMDGNILAVGAQGAEYVKTYEIILNTTGTYELNEIKIPTTAVYPNPSKGLVNLESDKTIDRLQVFNLAGQLMLEQSIQQQQTQLQLDLPAASYLLRMTYEDGSQSTERLLLND